MPDYVKFYHTVIPFLLDNVRHFTSPSYCSKATPTPQFPYLPETGEACPVQRNFGDLAFPQGEELIPHIDILHRILSGIFR